MKQQVTLSAKDECQGFVTDTGRDSSSEAQVGDRLRSVQQHREDQLSVNNVTLRIARTR